MARVDKTESAVGVVRGVLKEDVDSEDWGKVIGVGIDNAGLTVPGAGTSGIAGVAIFDRTNYQAGQRTDIFRLAEIVDVELTAGAVVYAHTTTGVVSTSSTSGTKIGYCVEADRLVVHLGS